VPAVVPNIAASRHIVGLSPGCRHVCKSVGVGIWPISRPVAPTDGPAMHCSSCLSARRSPDTACVSRFWNSDMRQQGSKAHRINLAAGDVLLDNVLFDTLVFCCRGRCNIVRSA
jgi:hypothetical protein